MCVQLIFVEYLLLLSLHARMVERKKKLKNKCLRARNDCMLLAFRKLHVAAS